MCILGVQYQGVDFEKIASDQPGGEVDGTQVTDVQDMDSGTIHKDNFGRVLAITARSLPESGMELNHNPSPDFPVFQPWCCHFQMRATEPTVSFLHQGSTE